MQVMKSLPEGFMGRVMIWEGNLTHRPGSASSQQDHMNVHLLYLVSQMQRSVYCLFKVHWDLPTEKCCICWYEHQELCSSFIYDFWFPKIFMHRHIFSRLLCLHCGVAFAQSHSVVMLRASQQWLQLGCLAAHPLFSGAGWLWWHTP